MKCESWKLKRNCVWLFVLLLLAVGVGTAAAVLDDSIRPLRLVTYNLLHGSPASGFINDDTNLELRLEIAIRELQALQPDIIALQEASQTRRHGDVPARIARRLGFNVAFASATDRLFRFWPLDKLIVGIMGFKEGVAILSRFPIVASESYDLPRCQRFLDPRILLRADLMTPRGPLQVYSTHTSRGGCQIARIGEMVRTHRGSGPVLLMGDLNIAETAPMLSGLRTEAGFVDVFRTANPDVPGLTVWQRIDVEQPTVFRRVDYILLLNGRDSTAAVRSSRVVLDRPGRLPDGAALWPSDHYGVFAEVEIR
jgi:endonuclease/exonuclease/phosphatase family metal-dependent hydrolase